MFSAGQTGGVELSMSPMTQMNDHMETVVVMRAGPSIEADSYQSGFGAGGAALFGSWVNDEKRGVADSGFFGIGPSYHHSGFFADHAVHRLGLAGVGLFKTGSMGLVWGGEIAYQWGSLGESSRDTMVPHTELVYSGIDEPPQYVTTYSLSSEKYDNKIWNVQYRVNIGYPIVGMTPELPLAWTIEADFAVGLGEKDGSSESLKAAGLSTRLYLVAF